MLAAQNAKHFRQIAEVGTLRSGFEIARNLFASSPGVAEKLAKELMSDWKRAEYYQAIECLFVALPRLLTFYEFPAEHHRHLRTTNVIESPFATVRLRTDAAKRFRSARSGTHLVFKIMESCAKRWRIISHPEKLKEVKLPNLED